MICQRERLEEKSMNVCYEGLKGIFVGHVRNSCIISADLLCHGERNGCVI